MIALWLITRLGALRRAAGAAAALAMRHPWQIALLLALAWGLWQRHQAAEAHAAAVQWQAAYGRMLAAHRLDLQSLARLRSAVTEQNQAIERLAQAGAARQQAAKAALQAASAHAADAEASARRIEAAPAAPPAPGCKSGSAVMAARSEL